MEKKETKNIVMVHVGVSPAQKKKFQEEAKARGLTLSGFIKNSLIERITRDKMSAQVN